MDNRPNLRRLNDLGVTGHQPAIKAYCQITGQEKEKIVEAILKQKMPTIRKLKQSIVSTGKGESKLKQPGKKR